MSHSYLENTLQDVLLSSASSLSSTNVDTTQISATPLKDSFNLSEKEKLERFYKQQDYKKYEVQLHVPEDEKMSVSSSVGDFRSEMEDFFGPSNRDQLRFYWFLVFTLCADITLMVLTYLYPEYVINRFAIKAYQNLTTLQRTQLYICVVLIKVLYGAVYYSSAIKASTSKSSPLLKTFCALSKLGVVLQLVFACFDCYELCILMFRIFALVLASSLNEKLMILMLLPQKKQKQKHMPFSI